MLSRTCSGSCMSVDPFTPVNTPVRVWTLLLLMCMSRCKLSTKKHLLLATATCLTAHAAAVQLCGLHYMNACMVHGTWHMPVAHPMQAYLASSDAVGICRVASHGKTQSSSPLLMFSVAHTPRSPLGKGWKKSSFGFISMPFDLAHCTKASPLEGIGNMYTSDW